MTLALHNLKKKVVVPDPFLGYRKGQSMFPSVTRLFLGAMMVHNLI